MKKLILLVCLFVGIGLSASVMAQSTGSAPFPGAKHLYTVDGGGTSTNYVWSVLKNDLSPSSDGVISQSGGLPTTSAEVNITWGSGLTTGAIYYVKVVKTVNGCSNTKMLKVTIAESTFQLAMATTDACYGAVTVGKDGSNDPTYTHGSATVVYTVTPTGLNATQGYTFTVTPPTIAGYTVGNVTASGTGVTNSGNNITVGANNVATLTFVITKDAATTNADTDGTAANFAAQASITNGVSSLGNAGLAAGAKNATSNVSRPGLSNITTN